MNQDQKKKILDVIINYSGEIRLRKLYHVLPFRIDFKEFMKYIDELKQKKLVKVNLDEFIFLLEGNNDLLLEEFLGYKSKKSLKVNFREVGK